MTTVQRDAVRDQDMIVFRKIWEACSLSQRNELVSLLHALVNIQNGLHRVTGFRLDAPNIAAARFTESPDELVDSYAINRELRALKHDVFITPEEYLCAIACWVAGDSYVQTKLVFDHPRWPYYDPFTSCEPAK